MTRRIDKPDTPADIELQACVDARQSFIMVAGAGSGKTTSLVKSLAHIERKFGKELRQRGQRVACITYTKVATNEIWGDVGHDPLFHVSTIHSFLWELIKPFQTDIRNWIEFRIQEKIDKLVVHNAKPKTHAKTRDNNNEKITRYEEEKAKLHAVPKFRYESASDFLNGTIGDADVIKMAPSLISTYSLLRQITAQKYPFFFVDESQDTFLDFVSSLKAIDADAGDAFCLGFFGDPMQQIYMTGIGKIEVEEGWSNISKPENFRCSKAVLFAINNIRSSYDALVQTIGNEDTVSDGTARLFILPANADRDKNLGIVRNWISGENNDQNWNIDDPIHGAKTLVIVHEMAANRLGFSSLHGAFHFTGATSNIRSGFKEGTHWALKPFLNCILPIVENYNHKNAYVMQLLRNYSPRLDCEYLKSVTNPSDHLSKLKADIDGLLSLFGEGKETTVGTVLEWIIEKKLMKLDGRFRKYLPAQEEGVLDDIFANIDLSDLEEDGSAIPTVQDLEAQMMDAFMNCPVQQLFGYQKYINNESVYSTQQGVKGAEFPRVMVVLDDDEGTHKHFSYEKLFGIEELSDTDKKNIKNGTQSVLDRTLRLFYVCCSRALEDLAVVLFTADPDAALERVNEKGYFPPEGIITFDKLTQ